MLCKLKLSLTILIVGKLALTLCRPTCQPCLFSGFTQTNSIIRVLKHKQLYQAIMTSQLQMKKSPKNKNLDVAQKLS